jgi:CRP/FNR family transcriptional regulator, polysaccharide utilization system transcription regulator
MKKILVIEDNKEMLENIAEMLELFNYTAIKASTAASGVEQAKTEKPELIICDIMLPDFDGYEVIKRLEGNVATKGIPFIFLTAKAEKSDVRKGMNMGADDYLTKPFDKADLINAIEARLKRNEFLRHTYSRDVKGLMQFIGEAKRFQLQELDTSKYVTKSYNKKDVIYNEGESSGPVFLITKGKVKTWKLSTEGKEFVSGILSQGDFFGYISVLENKPYSDSVTALEEVELAIIPQSDFISLITYNQEVSAGFIRMLANNISEKEERLLGLAYNTVKARTASALLNLYRKLQPDGIIKVSRDNLAGLVGTSPESLIRTLSDLKADKIIETDGKEIKISNPEMLERIMKFS